MKTVHAEFSVEEDPLVPDEALQRTINGTWEGIVTDTSGAVLVVLTGTLTGHPMVVASMEYWNELPQPPVGFMPTSVTPRARIASEV